jgi:hypothetical protein
LKDAEQALERGDNRRARAAARTVVAEGTPEEREAARALLARLAPDPAAIALLVICAVAIACVFAYYAGK